MSGERSIDDWEDLFDLICKRLSAIAPVANLSNDDAGAAFFVVDDDYGTMEQKVCLLSKNLDSRNVERALQSLLVGRFGHWAIFVAFEDGSERDGFIIRRGTIER